MKHANNNELGNLSSTPSALGLDQLCTCGEIEAYHNTFPGEDGRCTVLGSTCKQFTPARKPAASVVKHGSIATIGTIVEYVDDIDGLTKVATIIDFGAPGWFEVTHNGRPEDDAAIHESLVVRVVEWTEYLERKVA